MEQRQSSDSGHGDLFDLAFDCTEMISSLSRSIEYKSSGEDDAASDEIRRVDRLISDWVKGLRAIGASDIDKGALLMSLEEAQESLEKADNVIQSQ